MKFKSTGLVLALALALSISVAAQAQVSPSKKVSITVYNQNFGLVKDVRDITLKDGVNFVRFEDVAASIDPTSVNFASLTSPNSVSVREQNYQFDLMDQNTILTRSVGKTVKFRQYFSGGAAREIVGTLLSAPQVTVADSNGNVQQMGRALSSAPRMVLLSVLRVSWN